MRLQEKTVLSAPDQPYRMRRTYDQARSPFERLCATGVLSLARLQRLQLLHDQTNPRRLRQEIYHSIDQLPSLPCHHGDHVEDVLDSLAVPLHV